MGPSRSFSFLVNDWLDLLSAVIPIIIGLAVVFFLAGAIQFLMSPGDPQKLAASKRTMLWGTIALFIMVSFWGLVELIRNTFL